MKYLILLGLSLWAFDSFGCQSVHASSDTSLGWNILSKVLSKDREGSELLVFTELTDPEIQFLVKRKPYLLWNNIKLLYNISDDDEVTRILSNRYSGRLLFKEKPKPVTLNNTRGKAKIPAIALALKQPLRLPIVDFLIVLYNKPKEKSLIYYHIIDEGYSLAILERKNKFWQIAEFIVETLE